MNTPNPFIPQGSLLEHNKRRSRMKLAVSCVVVAGAAGLVAMLIQGCQRHEETMPPMEETNAFPPMETNLPPLETNVSPVVMPSAASNAFAPPVTPVTPPTPVTPIAPAAPATGTEYVVVQGDTLGKIAKRNGITLKALEDANPGVVPTRLKVGQKLTIPPGSSAAAAAENSAAPGSAVNVGGQGIYVVKSGDTLTKIARTHGTTVKAIQAANNLSTTKIKVGQKLKIPGAAAAAPAPAPAPAPVMPDTTTAPVGAPDGQ